MFEKGEDTSFFQDKLEKKNFYDEREREGGRVETIFIVNEKYLFWQIARANISRCPRPFFLASA